MNYLRILCVVLGVAGMAFGAYAADSLRDLIRATNGLHHQTAGGTLDQGGEDCASATVIPALPYTDSGTTVGSADDYDETCPYPNGTAPDVVYSYTPISLQLVTFSLCAGATDYDTKLYVYAGTCVSPALACNDDACHSPQYPFDFVSRLECVQLSAGVTYYIVVDGYSDESGSYTLTADACFGCPIECPPGAVLESEPVCEDDYEDHDNGGCGSLPVVFDTLACGQTMCATTGTFLVTGLNYRDTDWYLLNLETAADVSWTVHCAFDMLAMILAAGSPEPCEGFTLLANASGQCVIEVSAASLNPGLYFLWTAPVAFWGVPCSTLYWSEVMCTPLEQPIGQCCYATGCVDTTEAACAALEGTWTVGTSCADHTCLYAISDLTAYSSGADIVLRWSAVPAATFYEIYVSESGAEPWLLLDSTPSAIYAHAGVVNLEDGLFYRVVAATE